MGSRNESIVRSQQFRVWTLMTATLVVGVLLAFGRWAGEERINMGLGQVATDALPTWWVLAIEYGVLVAMVTALIRAERVDEFFASTETLIWLGGVCLFTAGLYHHHWSRGAWDGSVNGYGTFTEYLGKPSLVDLPLLLSAWPMAYGAIVVFASFMVVLGWKQSLVRWRWVLPAVYLGAVSLSWILFVLGPWNLKHASRWLAGSLFILPALVITVAVVRDPVRKSHWTNLIAAIWLLAALAYPWIEHGLVPVSVSRVLITIGHGYKMLVLGALLILAGSIGAVLSKARDFHGREW